LPNGSYDFAVCKNCDRRSASPEYRLREGVVWACSVCGLHYIDHLDPAGHYDGEIDPESLTPQRREYLENRHRDNPERFRRHVDIVRRYKDIVGLHVLDVGSGGGLFLSMINEEGGHGIGAELWDPAILYARETHGLTVHKYPVEHPFWQDHYKSGFDVVTLWDVIEHVNFPLQTLRSAWALLREGGLLFIDTPCRDAFFHRLGSFTYRLTAGRFPTLLNMMYSTVNFGHKQIISIYGMADMMGRSGFEMLDTTKIYELSLPCECYLRKRFRSRILTGVLDPVVKAFVGITRIRNKMIAVGRKAELPPNRK